MTDEQDRDVTEVTFSFVAPVYNEAEVLPTFYAQLRDAADALGEPYEIIFVNDGSTDESLESFTLSVPDVERIWKLPEPDGDHFHIRFPFTIGGEQAYGINQFLLEYFDDHSNQSVGDFFAQDSSLSIERIGDADVIRFDSQVWIAPFDFGISQSLSLFTMPTDEEGIFAPEMHLYRKSGTPAAWARMNHRFLKLIRQQFLLWRILSGEEREYFAAQAKVQLGIATDKDREILETMLKGPDAPEEAEEQPASDEEA